MPRRQPPQRRQEREAYQQRLQQVHHAVSSPPKKRIAATLDLHGQTKERAISKLTWFLQSQRQNNRGHVWVNVITGTGSHGQDGPVLRTAVQKLLEKRCMTYSINQGRGSFTVDATSGIILIKPDIVDTKVLLQPASTDEGIKLPLNCNIKREVDEEHIEIFTRDELLLPSQVAADDANVEKTKALSALEATSVKGDIMRESNLVHKAMELSAKLRDEEERFEEERVQKVLEASRLEEEANLELERQELEHILRLSQHESSVMESEEDLLKKAIEESITLGNDHYNIEHDREAEMLEEAMRLSLADQQMPDLDEDEKYFCSGNEHAAVDFRLIAES